MGVAELRSAFNEGAAGKASCEQAHLNYEQHSDLQWQRLTFRGKDASGNQFEVRSDRLRPETDLLVAARNIGQGFVSAAANDGVS